MPWAGRWVPRRGRDHLGPSPFPNTPFGHSSHFLLRARAPQDAFGRGANRADSARRRDADGLRRASEAFSSGMTSEREPKRRFQANAGPRSTCVKPMRWLAYASATRNAVQSYSAFSISANVLATSKG